MRPVTRPIDAPSALTRAQRAWGDVMPDWIKALAEACTETSLRKTAATLAVSPAIVSLAIGKKREKLDFIKARVEAVLMISVVACPVLGAPGKNECLDNQTQPFSSVNPLRLQLYRDCRNGCPYYKETKK